MYKNAQKWIKRALKKQRALEGVFYNRDAD
jgi:hypothetical protein